MYYYIGVGIHKEEKYTMLFDIESESIVSIKNRDIINKQEILDKIRGARLKKQSKGNKAEFTGVSGSRGYNVIRASLIEEGKVIKDVPTLISYNSKTNMCGVIRCNGDKEELTTDEIMELKEKDAINNICVKNGELVKDYITVVDEDDTDEDEAVTEEETDAEAIETDAEVIETDASKKSNAAEVYVEDANIGESVDTSEEEYILREVIKRMEEFDIITAKRSILQKVFKVEIKRNIETSMDMDKMVSVCELRLSEGNSKDKTLCILKIDSNADKLKIQTIKTFGSAYDISAEINNIKDMYFKWKTEKRMISY